jgi:hypothetical protein
MLPAIAVYMCCQVLSRQPIQVCSESLPPQEKLRFYFWVREWSRWTQRTVWS